MSTYYQYKYTNTDALYARVKHEFRSYFESGILDDSMFDIWIKDCLDRLGKGSMKISETVLYLDNHTTDLPDDLIDIREASLCSEYTLGGAITGGSLYTSVLKETAYKIYDSADIRCCPCDSCDNPDIIEAMYRIDNKVIQRWHKEKLLIPQPISDIHRCTRHDIYDIHDCKLITPVKSGTIHIKYYVDPMSESGELMIPDNSYIKTYMREYLKLQLYYDLFNNLSDESINVIKYKLDRQEMVCNNALSAAEAETRRDTIFKKIERWNRQDRSLNKYEIPRVNYRR